MQAKLQHQAETVLIPHVWRLFSQRVTNVKSENMGTVYVSKNVLKKKR
jgi:hypothetical protein